MDEQAAGAAKDEQRTTAAGPGRTASTVACVSPTVEAAPAGLTASMTGTVVRLDPAAGVLLLDGPDGLMRIRAAPQQMLNLMPGQLLSVGYRTQAGERWWWPLEQVSLPAERYAQHGNVVGPVHSVDRRMGALVVGEKVLRAHPQLIREVVPGQMVSVGFVRVGPAAWIQGLTGDADGGVECSPTR